MAGRAFEHLGTTRGQSISYVDPADVVLIGRDTPHKSAAEHWAWDPRVLNDPDEDIVVGMMHEGVHYPVLVVRDDGAAIVFEGRQRTINAREANRRLKKLGKEPIKLPFVVRRVSDAKASLLGVMLNAHRIDETPLEKAEKASTMLAMGHARDRIAGSFRVDVQTVNVWLDVLTCDKRVRAAFDAGRIGLTACARLAKLSKEEQATALDEMIASGDTSVAAADHAVKTRRAAKAGVEAPYAIPSRSHIKRILALRTDGDVDAAQLPDEFIAALRWIAGDLAPTSVKGLSACMTWLAKPSAEFDHASKSEDAKPVTREKGKRA